MHLKRWITGLCALPFLILLVYLGGIYFVFLVSIACVCSLWEYFRIVFNADRRMMHNAVTFWGYLISIVILIAAHIAGPASILGLIALNLILAGVLSVFIYKANPAVVEIIQKQVLGTVYIPLSLALLVLIRNEPGGMTWIFLFLAVIVAGDICAFSVGSCLGRHKLSPA
ncbi:MAG: phosphatidate cytidylyltransferase, partial [Desulfobacterales bacterium]